MPFVALLDGVRVCIWDANLDEIEPRRDELSCPACKAKMTLARGEVRCPHFRHWPGQSCDYEWDSEMTQEHREAQRRLYEHHAHALELSAVTLEAPIAMDWRAKGRVADLLVGAPGGFQIVHEVQVSPIRRTELEQRSRDYLEAGVARVVWWLGSRSHYINDLGLEGVETLRLDELNQGETRHAARLSRWLEMMASHEVERSGALDPASLSCLLHGHRGFEPLYALLFETREYTFTPWNLFLGLTHENLKLHARIVKLESDLSQEHRTNKDLKRRVAELEQIPMINEYERNELEKRRRKDEVLKKIVKHMHQVLLQDDQD